tara:strand:- start:607 stop:1164 length:558 start_codon:yes stop_codon:yes gene_type:complete
MTIEQRDAKEMPGFDRFIANLTDSNGVKGLVIRPPLSSEPELTDLRFLWNKENPRLVFSPLCEHRATGYWAVAVFHAVDTDKDGDQPNLRASLAVSMIAGSPVVIHGDFALLCTDGWGYDPENPTFTPPVDMPADIAADLAEQFTSPEDFISGPFVRAAMANGVEVSEIASALFANHKHEDWGDE